ncbi:MAG: GH1 family beta-glucosidase [Chitinophagales bacterium]
MLKLSALAAIGATLNPHQVMAEIINSEMMKADFGKDFLWGTATASYQIEGGWNLDGKSPSVWDTFTSKSKNIHDGSNGNEACDFYHKYKEDIAIMKSLNFDVFRFSIAWTRILPDGTGKINQAGIDFYNNVIDECLAQGLQPWITLYHWDLPQVLEDKGGWPNRDVIDWFKEYVDVCTKAFGDRVKNWMIFNEPLAFTALGYLAKMHAPGKRSFKKFKQAVHHVTLCQAEGGRVVRANVPEANVGTTFSVTAVEPKDPNKKRHVKAAKKEDAFFNRLFIEPTLGMGYPTEDLKMLKGIEKYMEEGDEEKMVFDFDFFGVQNYFRTVAKFSLWPPVMWANVMKGKDLVEDESELTAMGWEVYPKGMYDILKQIGAYGVPLYITENGMGLNDELNADGTINDFRRTQFYKDYLANVLKAKNEGVDVRGYYQWTFMDNFEWAEGYGPRFGIVYNDFETQTRYLKDSAKWWQSFLAG